MTYQYCNHTTWRYDLPNSGYICILNYKEMALKCNLPGSELHKFRTRICERYVTLGKCDFADRCQFSHDLAWSRRPQWKYNYGPEMCPNVKMMKSESGEISYQSKCEKKRECSKCHTREEQLWHPATYKTIVKTYILG
ncbi:zinc finger (CCCH type) motif-containing protein [Cardiosporidium cionae]|uniref:Zinc finger (CCCH type) motif-containing protein n=1 Tax=Cardiosporidium cionae TaxID=476202 RepID=A0ABQ7JDP3_9APIC|nr:zinc finger (CCCH type) motif-containing protein [Cardiosporidium cionae]|eukprot:KAF8822079.1 zinc finger (CCCH type) motif-containing protein [Cardiosporidium cionae]